MNPYRLHFMEVSLENHGMPLKITLKMLIECILNFGANMGGYLRGKSGYLLKLPFELMNDVSDPIEDLEIIEEIMDVQKSLTFWKLK